MIVHFDQAKSEVKERDAARKELAEAKAAHSDTIDELTRLRSVTATANAAQHAAEAALEDANARIAELEKALGIVLADRHAAALDAEGETVRAERAEARIAELERANADLDVENDQLKMEQGGLCMDRARAEAECKAMREALEEIALELTSGGGGVTADAARRIARAALNPTPAAPTAPATAQS